MTIVAVLIE